MKKLFYLILSIVLVFSFSNCIMDPSAEGNLVPKTVVDDPALPSAVINSVKLHIEVLSKGTPSAANTIIFLHGGPGFDYRSLLPIANSLIADASFPNLKIVLYDQRGGGLSQRLAHDDASLSLAQHTADFETIRSSYTSGGAVKVIAHSWGACSYHELY